MISWFNKDLIFISILAIVGIICFGFIGIMKKKNKVPIELHSFLTVGALYYGMYSENLGGADVNKLKSAINNKNFIIKKLNEHWGIVSKEDAVKMIMAGINGEIQANYIDGNLTELETLIDIKQCIKNINKVISEDFYSAYAWDLERAAMLVRDSYGIGLLNEEETFDYLKQIIFKAQVNFESWEQYAVSFLVGRIIWLNLEYIESGEKLTTEDFTFYEYIGLLFGKKILKFNISKTTEYALWKNYPLKEIEI
jgi:Protein of unknown function (DUF1266).